MVRRRGSGSGRSLTRWPLLLAVMLIANGAFVSTAHGEWRDSFETPQTSWQLVDRDTSAMRVREHTRTLQQAHSGQGCELLRLQADFGTYIHYGQAIPAARVIDELAISLWVRSDRAGLQLLASVVLPRTVNPRDGQPLRAALRGTIYSDVGKWQQLVIQSPERLLKQQEASLRFEYGPQLDIREAYIDLVVVNVYGGRGETTICFDDLELTGLVRTTETRPAAGGQTNDSSGTSPFAGTRPRHQVRVQGAILEEDARPVFLRVIEHQGEPMTWLRSLGFNCIKLRGPPTADQLAQAADLGLWLIAPLPTEQQLNQLGDLRSVVAWTLGDDLRAEDLDFVRSEARRQRQRQSGQGPLLACSPRENIADYSRVADVLILEPPLPHGRFELAKLSAWVTDHRQACAAMNPTLIGVRTDVAPELSRQWQALGYGLRQSLPLEPEQLRLMSYHAAAGGARGIYFRSSSRLDSDDELTRLRARMVELINRELIVLQPWLAGGRATGAVDVDQPRLASFGLQTQHSQLLILCRTADEQQFSVSRYVDVETPIVVPTLSSSAVAYELTNAGLVRLNSRRLPGGLRLELSHLGLVSAVIVTQENLVMDHVAQSSAEGRPRRAALQYEVQQLAFEQTDRILALRTDLVQPAHQQLLRNASRQLQLARTLVDSHDYRAAQNACEQASNLLSELRHDWWEREARGFPSPLSSPFCSGFMLLPFHWDLARRIHGQPWSGNAVPAGGIEDLNHMVESGWTTNLATAAETSTSSVALSYQSPQSGRACLHLSVAPKQENSKAAPLHVATAPVQVRRGQLVQIQAWVHIPRPLRPGGAGLAIYDSSAGPSLAEHLYATAGWQAVTLYRVATSDEPLVVHFDLDGPGSVSIDDVSIRIVDVVRDEGHE